MKIYVPVAYSKLEIMNSSCQHITKTLEEKHAKLCSVFIHFPDATKQANLMVIQSFHA